MRDFNFEQLVFSGGGIRCFWHGGFLAAAGDAIALAPKRISTVSGGALSAASWIAGREQRLLERMQEAFRENESNVASGKSNYTPHEELYRAVVRDTLDGDADDAVAEGPECEVLLGVPRGRLPTRLAVAMAGAAYFGEKALTSRPHLQWARAFALRPIRVDMRKAAREGRLVDLICAAATIPPVFDVPQWDGCPVVDGGMIDKAPLPSGDAGRTFILLTKRYRDLPHDDRRTYVQPSRETPADKIDFADHTKVQETWDLGKSDGAAWLSAHA